MVDQFVDVGADDRERLRELVTIGLQSEHQLVQVTLAEATRVVRRRGTVRDIYEALRGLLLATVNRPLR